MITLTGNTIVEATLRTMPIQASARRIAATLGSERGGYLLPLSTVGEYRPPRWPGTRLGCPVDSRRGNDTHFDPMRLIAAYQGRDYVSRAAGDLRAHQQISWPHSILGAATKGNDCCLQRAYRRPLW
jgi:hypothetical protein